MRVCLSFDLGNIICISTAVRVLNLLKMGLEEIVDKFVFVNIGLCFK